MIAAAVALAAGGAAPAKKTGATRRKPAPKPVTLQWHVESLHGDEVTSLDGDVPINPASVVKVATTWWALERLGPDHRFDTLFETRGATDAAKGVLRGDLIVRGGTDPDFHVENAFLVAARLNAMGIRQVSGALRVDDRFWMGWEGGSERVVKASEARATMMAQRLRAGLDPKRWTGSTRRAWQAFAARQALPAARPPSVTVLGGAGPETRPRDASATWLMTHRSKPLVESLRRFDCYSNNDIERVGASLGSPGDLARLLAERWQLPADTLRFETTSGLGTNRMTPRLVVRLLLELRRTCERLGLSVESVLPVAGCDPGTLNHSFARLCRGPNAMAVVAKTGTLTYTDGGTAVLAGFVNTGKGDLAFCVAAPRAAGRLDQARRQQLEWVERLIAASDGPRFRTCAAPMGNVEGDARILPLTSAGVAAAGVAAH